MIAIRAGRHRLPGDRWSPLLGPGGNVSRAAGGCGPCAGPAPSRGADRGPGGDLMWEPKRTRRCVGHVPGREAGLMDKAAGDGLLLRRSAIEPVATCRSRRVSVAGGPGRVDAPAVVSGGSPVLPAASPRVKRDGGVGAGGQPLRPRARESGLAQAAGGARYSRPGRPTAPGGRPPPGARRGGGQPGPPAPAVFSRNGQGRRNPLQARRHPDT